MRKSSGKFFSKIYDLRERLATAVLQFKKAVEIRTRLNQLRPPPTPPKPFVGMSYNFPTKRIGFLRKNTPNSMYVSMHDITEESKGLPDKKEEELGLFGFEGFKPLAEPSIYDDPRSHKLYPRITPLMQELDKSQLKKDNEEVESLCKKPPSP